MYWFRHEAFENELLSLPMQHTHRITNDHSLIRMMAILNPECQREVASWSYAERIRLLHAFRDMIRSEKEERLNTYYADQHGYWALYMEINRSLIEQIGLGFQLRDVTHRGSVIQQVLPSTSSLHFHGMTLQLNCHSLDHEHAYLPTFSFSHRETASYAYTASDLALYAKQMKFRGEKGKLLESWVLFWNACDLQFQDWLVSHHQTFSPLITKPYADSILHGPLRGRTVQLLESGSAHSAIPIGTLGILSHIHRFDQLELDWAWNRMLYVGEDVFELMI